MLRASWRYQVVIYTYGSKFTQCKLCPISRQPSQCCSTSRIYLITTAAPQCASTCPCRPSTTKQGHSRMHSSASGALRTGTCHVVQSDCKLHACIARDDRVCEVCKSGCVENEHHFLFDCPAYAHIRYSHATLFHGIQTVSSVINSNSPCLLGRYLRQCFQYRQSVLG